VTCRLLLVIAFTILCAAPAAGSAISASVCTVPVAEPAYAARIEHALAATRDVWGDALVARPGGPTYAGAAHHLAPLLYASGPRGRPLTASGVYYLPFSYPLSDYGARAFALHVADGSQIVTRRAGGPSLTISVGANSSERFGSCLRRLATPRLRDGWLPVLDTAYTDARGVRYRQESFAGRIPGVRALVSFVRISADARGASAPAAIRLRSSSGGGAVIRVPRGAQATLYAEWLNTYAPRVIVTDAANYAVALARVQAFWESRTADGTTFQVPELRVMNAERALLVQELTMTWRYSIGNTYEELSYAEAQDVAQLFAEYGFMDNAKAILRFSLRRLQLRFTDWRAGERLVAGALYYRLSHDRAYVEEETPELSRVVAVLERRLESRRAGGLLVREQYSSDIGTPVYGLHGQTVVWQGLLDMGRIWDETGHRALADRCRAVALRLERGLRRAVAASMRRLPDGSLFVPAALLAGSAPFTRLTDTRDGSYWNLVMPYALASGFFRPHSVQADGIWRYLSAHGSRLLGLVRANASRIYGAGSAGLSGTDQVYGFNLSRFLADQDEPDQLALTLYGMIAAGMTPNTFVSGEAATVAPLHGVLARTMFLPPNADSNAAFLETLRLQLVHETRGPKGSPRGLELAFATPRAWLGAGKAIEVNAAPTSFGPVSYSLRRSDRRVDVSVQAPHDSSLRSLHLRLRLPAGERVVAVQGIAPRRFDPSSQEIDLSRLGATRFVAVVG
jgi:hypothetical protein